MKQFVTKIKAENPDLIVMVRPDYRSLRLNAFTKKDGEKAWTRYHESCPIPIGIMLSSHVPSTAAAEAVAGAAAAAAVAVAAADAAATGDRVESMISS